VSYQIVVGVDGSDNSAHALRWALDEARLRDGATITALFAWELPMVGVPGAFERDEIEREAKAMVAGQVASLIPDGDGGVQVDAVVAEGAPSASLIAACEQTNADLLVLGSRGREGFAGLLLGSVGQQCAAYAPCPVTIVKDKPTA
jgi:nucleotide-binding universal stress UspA family protein